jgi:Tfp pilus assembly protein PilF
MHSSPVVGRRMPGIALGLGVVLALSGCGATQGWVMNNSGRGYYQQGNYAMARQEFAQAVALHPHNPDYRHNLAMTLKKMGDLESAERILKHNLTIDMAHQPTYHALAQVMSETGRQPEAEHLLYTWAETQPYNPKAQIELAWLHRERGDLMSAEQSLRQALRADPQNSIALAHLGQVYQELGQAPQAAAMYQQALAINSNQPLVQTRLASLGRAAQPMNGPPMGYGPQMMMAGYPPQGPMSQPMQPQYVMGPMGPQPILSPQMLAATRGPASGPARGSMPAFAPPTMGPSPMMGQPPMMMAGGPMMLPSGPLPSGPMTATWSPSPTPGEATISTMSVVPPPPGLTVPPVDAFTVPVPESTLNASYEAGPTIALPTMSSAWQPVQQASGAVVAPNADPAHTGQSMDALPIVEPH